MYLVVTLDNLRASKIIEAIPNSSQDKFIYTHIISFQWVATLAGGKRVLSLQHTWIADLQGSTPDPNMAASTIVRFLVRNALNVQSNPHSLPWQKRINDYPWKDTLEFYARKIHGATHEPRITRIPYPKQSKKP